MQVLQQHGYNPAEEIVSNIALTADQVSSLCTQTVEACSMSRKKSAYLLLPSDHVCVRFTCWG